MLLVSEDHKRRSGAEGLLLIFKREKTLPEHGVKGTYLESKRKKLLFIAILSVLLVAASLVALGVGAVDIPVGDVLSTIGHQFFPDRIGGPEKSYYETIIVGSREPRILLAVITGVSLAMSGVVMQGLLRNPLVSPFTLGLSSAASFGAALALVMGPSLLGTAYYGSVAFFGGNITTKNLLIILFAFISGMSSVVLVLAIARAQHLAQSVLILSGIVVNYLFSAGISFMKYISEDHTLREIALWLMGGMWGATWNSVMLLVPLVMVSLVLMMRYTVDMNTLSAGDDVAKNLGVNVKRLRISGMVLSAFVTSACLAFTGVIGFIGLMAPHICRMLIGTDNRYLLPASALMGALILLISDTVARMILRPAEIPVGIIMYLIGGAFFIWLVTRKSGRFLT